MSQTSMSIAPDLGFRGLIADSGGDTFLVSRANENASAQGFGIGVIAGTDPEKQFNIFSGAGTLLGVLAHKHGFANQGLADPEALEQNEMGSIMRRGRIWVRVEEAVTAHTSDVYVRHTAGGGGSEIGAFRTDADTASAQQVTNATWLTSTSGAGIAMLEINLP